MAAALLSGVTPMLTAPAADAAPKKISKADDAKARTLYKDGDKAYAEGDYEKALALFQEAYALSERPLLQYNIGNALERLGRPGEAADALEKYLPHSKKGERDTLEKRIENLRERAAEEQKAEAERKAAEEKKREEATERARKEAEAKKRRESETTAKQGESNTLAYVLLGVGAVGIGSGTYFGLRALSSRSDAEAGCKDQGGDRLCSRAAQDAVDRDQSSSLIADVSFGVGLVAAGVGAYLLLSPKTERAPASAALPLAVDAQATPHGGKVTLGGQF